jgi:hypothetical protein
MRVMPGLVRQCRAKPRPANPIAIIASVIVGSGKNILARTAIEENLSGGDGAGSKWVVNFTQTMASENNNDSPRNPAGFWRI